MILPVAVPVFILRSEPALSLVELLNDIFEIFRREIREVVLEEEPFGVGRLPEEEVAGALLTGGTDDEVNVGERGVVEVGADRIDGVIPSVVEGRYGSFLCFVHAVYRTDDFIFSSIIQGHVEREVRIVLRLLGDVFERFCEREGDPVGAAGVEEAGSLLRHISSVFPNVAFEEIHELAHFFGIPLPILRRKAPDGQYSDCGVLSAPVGDGAKIFDGFRVAVPWVEPLRARPATVAVGNNCEVEGVVILSGHVSCYAVGDWWRSLRAIASPSANHGVKRSGVLSSSSVRSSVWIHLQSLTSARFGTTSASSTMPTSTVSY